MSNKKNIDRLFQERFKDFEAAPPPMATWDEIEKELDGKKPVAVLPLWIKWVGIAAGIALLATIAYTGYSNFENDKDHNNQIVIDSQENTILDNGNSSSQVENTPNTNKQIAVEDSNSLELNSGNFKDIASDNTEVLNSRNNKGINNLSSTNTDQSISTINKNQQDLNNGRNLNSKNNNPLYVNAASNNQNSIKKLDQTIQGVQQSNFAINQSIVDPVSQNENLLNMNKDSQSVIKKEDNSINNDLELINPLTNTTAITAVEQPQDSTELKKSLNDAIAEQKEKDEENEDALPFKKWNASSVIAPVYSNTIGGSPIDEQFADNQKAAGVNLSYGVNVGYNLSSRLSIRTGVHRVNMSYNTGDIIYGRSTQPGDVQLLSVNSYDSDAVSNSGDISTDDLGSSFSQEFLSDNTFNGFQGEISQRLGYLEVPLEVKYKLLNNKFSVNVMGGMSALFLTDNSIAVSNNTGKLELGEDDNFNSFNQSANFGLGFDYLFTDQLGITIEPIFKYQLNALRENTANFKPFSVGVYSGVSYKF